MSFRLLAWAKNQRVGDPVAKSILLLLAEAANAAGTCFPSQATLSEDSEVPRRTLQRKIQLLVDLGLVSIEERKRNSDGGRSSNLYRLNAPSEFLRQSGEDDGDPRVTVAQGATPPDGGPPAPIGGATNEPSLLTVETSDEVSPRRREVEDGFERFWAVYPRKEEQRAAFRQFERVVRGRAATIDELISGAQRYAIATHDRERSKVKLAENWLKAEAWCEPGSQPSGAAPAEPQQCLPRTAFDGPAELRAAVVSVRGEAWVAAWIDPCGWDEDARQLIPRLAFARDRIRQELGHHLRQWGVSVGDPRRPSP